MIQNLQRKINSMKRLRLFLRLADLFCVFFTVFAYIITLFCAYTKDFWLFVKLILISGVPFVLVSIIRHIINAPRPYELYNIYDDKEKKKEGRSFPSRHAFSVFSIGTALLFVYPILASAILLLGVLLSFLRVFLGKHFIRDVLAGGLVGIVSSLIGGFIFLF